MSPRLRSLGLILIVAMAMFAVTASAAHAAKLTAGSEARVISGTQVKTHELLLRDNSNLGFTCTEASVIGEVPAGGYSSVLLHPWYTGCTAFGLKATMNTTGCNYRFDLAESSGPEYPATMGIECSTAGIVLTTLTCEIVFPSQTGLSSATFTNTPKAGLDTVMLGVSVEGIDYVVTKDGIGCPLKGKGSYSEAAYVGTTELKGEGQDIWVE